MMRFPIQASAIVCSLLLWPFCSFAADEHPFSSRYTLSQLTRMIPNTPMTKLLEPANSSFWKTNLPAEIRRSYILLGEYDRGKLWKPIPLSLFEEYSKTGNRRNYEVVCEENRRKLAHLAMAEIMENRQRFITDIVNGLHHYINETWWGVPAHYPKPRPEADKQIVDLFNAETANLLAWVVFMLHDSLEAAENGICHVICEEINRRILIPARTTNYDWKRRITNWNPWICANWLSCVLFCEQDEKSRLDAINQILVCMDTFYQGYPDDGGCDEGISYWYRSAAALFECLQLLKTATNGAFDFSSDPKLKAMGSFLYQSYIGKKRFVNFADTYSDASIQINIVYPFGRYIQDDRLMGLAAFYAEQKGFSENPGLLFDSSLSRELLFLSQYNSFKTQEPEEPLMKESWFPNLQFATARQAGGTTDGLYLAAKGGHNEESHNHNDVGQFIVYKNAEPLIIDIGAGSYTATTFSNLRYELFNCRSAYHNVPIINGYEQQQGKNHRATDVSYKRRSNSTTLTLDISKAYPQETDVARWKRTIQLNRYGEVLITENYRLKSYQQPSEIILICCGEIVGKTAGQILIRHGETTGVILYNEDELSPTVEKIKFQDEAIQKSWKNYGLYRITLRIFSHNLKGKIQYSIQ